MAKRKEYIATITSKGQITIPVEIREELGLAAQDKVIFRMVGENRVVLEPLPMTLEQAYGSVLPRHRPEDFDTLEKIAGEEKEERWLKQRKA